MIVCGVWTRMASVVFAGNMIVAILMAHSADIFSINAMTGGWAIELPAFYLLASAVLCLTGAGKYAVTKGSFLD
jgi:putative oxidoreductase